MEKQQPPVSPAFPPSFFLAEQCSYVEMDIYLPLCHVTGSKMQPDSSFEGWKRNCCNKEAAWRVVRSPPGLLTVSGFLSPER